MPRSVSDLTREFFLNFSTRRTRHYPLFIIEINRRHRLIAVEISVEPFNGVKFHFHCRYRELYSNEKYRPAKNTGKIVLVGTKIR